MKGSRLKDLTWRLPDGSEMTDADWADNRPSVLQVAVSADGVVEMDERGHQLRAKSVLMIFNAEPEEMEFLLDDLGKKT